MAEAARQELNDTGVRVTSIEPGMVDTPFFDNPVSNALEPDDIARAVMFAVSAAAARRRQRDPHPPGEPADMTAGPGFAGFPDKVRLSDWLLVEWVATAKQRRAVPRAVVPGALAAGVDGPPARELGVMRSRRPGPTSPTIAREATAAARAWLERNPRPRARAADDASAASSAAGPTGSSARRR